jgi:hypothetical protein
MDDQATWKILAVIAILLAACLMGCASTLPQEDFSDTGVGCVDDCLE